MTISIGKTLFLILMPFVYRCLHQGVLEERSRYYKEHEKISNIILLPTYYAIEIVFAVVFYCISKEWVFMKNTPLLSEIGLFPIFVICAIIYIVIHLIVISVDSIDDCIPIGHLILLIFFFAIFMWSGISMASNATKDKIFNEMPYEITNEYTIHLKALSDTHTTEGQIRGSRYYINGTINDSYEIYYSFVDDKGSTVIRHFPYSEQYVDIYEQDDCEDPRIEFTVYSKQYKDKSASYTTYVVYIPTGTNNITMDME